VKEGTLRLVSPVSLGPNADVQIAPGATVAVDHPGETRIARLTVSGTVQPAGTYSAERLPGAISGTGALVVP
jgi:hypothetical protein